MQRLQNVTLRRFLHVSAMRNSSDTNEIPNSSTEEAGSFVSFSKISETTVNSTEQRRRLIREIIRVNHVCELGAMAISLGQLAVMKQRYSKNTHSSSEFEMPVNELTPSTFCTLDHKKAQEKLHLDEMERLMASNKVKSTILAPICYLAGYALGIGTALMGQKNVMTCTIAVEKLIVEHYNNQIEKLLNDDPKANQQLLETLSKLRDEEIKYQDKAIENNELPFCDILKTVIQTGCKAAIWITKKI